MQESQRTALHIAAERGYDVILGELLDRRAKSSLKDKVRKPVKRMEISLKAHLQQMLAVLSLCKVAKCVMKSPIYFLLGTS